MRLFTLVINAGWKWDESIPGKFCRCRISYQIFILQANISRDSTFSLPIRAWRSRKMFPTYKSASVLGKNVNGQATAEWDSRQSCFSIKNVRTCFSDSVYVVYLISRELIWEKYQKNQKVVLLLCLSRARNKNYCVSLFKSIQQQEDSRKILVKRENKYLP